MKTRIVIFAFAVLVLVWAVPVQLAARPNRGSQQRERKREGKTMTDKPIACNLFGLNEAQRKRRQELARRLLTSVRSTRELENGYAIQLAGTSDEIVAVAEFIALERVCCPFLQFELAVGGEGEPMWLSLKGGEGVKEFLKTELGLK